MPRLRPIDALDARWPPFVQAATLLPGVKDWGRGDLEVPDNAMPLVPKLNPPPFNESAKALSYTLTTRLAELHEVRWKPGEEGRTINALSRRGDGTIEPITLTPYQQAEPIRWAAKRGVLFRWAPGAGKSIGSLLWSLLAPGLIIVIAPARARRQWIRQIRQYTTIDPYIVQGETPRLIPPNIRLIMTTWETLPYHVYSLIAMKPTSIIYDEGHHVKSPKRVRKSPLTKEEAAAILDEDSDRAKNIKQLEDGQWVEWIDLANIASSASKLAKAAKRRCLTTATLIKNELRDAWAQLDYLEPYGFGSQWDFRKRYCGAAPIGFNGSYVDVRRDNQDELKARVAALRSYVPIEVSHKYLPPLRREVIHVPISEQNRSDVLKAEFAAVMEKGEDAVVELKIQDACARKRRWVINEVTEALYGEQSNKLKVVVFTGRRKDCESITTSLIGTDARGRNIGKMPKGVAYFTAHGGDSETVRGDIVEAYMAHPGPALFIGTRDAFGESIDLHDTDLVLMAMLPTTPGGLVQNEYRFQRLGGVRKCLVKYPIAIGTYDEKLASLLINKLPAAEDVGGNTELAGLKAALRGTNDVDIRKALYDAIVSGAKPKKINTDDEDANVISPTPMETIDGFDD